MAIVQQGCEFGTYTLDSTPGPASGTWTAVPSQTDIPGRGGIDTLTAHLPTGNRRFYRIGERLP